MVDWCFFGVIDELLELPDRFVRIASFACPVGKTESVILGVDIIETALFGADGKQLFKLAYSADRIARHPDPVCTPPAEVEYPSTAWGVQVVGVGDYLLDEL